MKRSRSLMLVLSSAFFAGCATTEQHVHLPGDPANPQLSLSMFRGADEASSVGQGVVHLGAGDSLGREVFVHYLASLETEDTGERIVTAEADVPAER